MITSERSHQTDQNSISKYSQLPAMSIGEIVKNNFRAATLMEHYGLDFCCGGDKPLREACDERHVDLEEVTKALAKLGDPSAHDSQFLNWPIDELADYIVMKHHGYIRDQIPIIIRRLVTVEERHRYTYPELREVAKLFTVLSREITFHLQKEERILFPRIREIATLERLLDRGEGESVREAIGEMLDQTIALPIHRMIAEHETAAEMLEKIRHFTKNYRATDDHCTTLRVLYQELEAFEQDLHRHVFLENQVLFPKAILAEEKLTQAID
jgi:regulator of cell morphogenesis and NO signaling